MKQQKTLVRMLMSFISPSGLLSEASMAVVLPGLSSASGTY
jgi:hypothetical protein